MREWNVFLVLMIFVGSCLFLIAKKSKKSISL